MSRHRLAYAAAAVAVLAAVVAMSGAFHRLSNFSRDRFFRDPSAKFEQALERARQSDAGQYASIQEGVIRLQRETQINLGAPPPISIAQAASWLSQLHKGGEASVRFWSPVAQCVLSGDCLPGPRHAQTCVDLSNHLQRLSEIAADVTGLQRASGAGLSGPGFAVPSFLPMQTVVKDGCERVPAIAQAVEEARASDQERRVASAQKAWDAIRAAPTMEAVQRYMAVYGAEAEQTRNPEEVPRLVRALEEKQRLAANRGFCDAMKGAAVKPTSSQSLVLALTRASVKPAYCVTESGTATCGWLDLIEELSEDYQPVASFRAEALAEAMRSCAPPQGEMTRETYEDVNNPACPAEQRMYSSGELNIDVVVSHCRFAQLRVSKAKTG